MEREINVLYSLIEFLISHGYPENSLALEWNISRGYKVDLAVVDPDTNKPIALFEIKRRKTEESTKMAIRQLETYSKVLGDEQVPTYIVFGRDGDPPFEIYYLKIERDEFGGKKDLSLTKVPDFSLLEISEIRKAISKTQKKRQETLTLFHIICWSLAIIVTALLYLEFINKIKITTERLALIAVIIGLILIPFAGKLKILGFEFERLQRKKKI